LIVSEMTVIMGVDPGSACTGYGIVKTDGIEVTYIASGVIELNAKTARYEKLCEIHRGIGAVIRQHHPAHFAIEEVFYSRNAKSALTLGEARGAAILAASLCGLPVYEYSAREVKQSVTGNGAAHKSQVSFMLTKLLRLAAAPDVTDESDALAIAVCHAFKNRDWRAA
jgi:crossover junction endodeoxyribonuclease RuvC